jgi:N-acylneuraminate cytidylyltransferase
VNRLGIIPARGGSKRLPRKNILELNGKPLLAYTVEAALNSGVLERVIVSTEDEEIARVGGAAGAEVLLRPGELASDSARVRDVCVHVIEELSQERPIDCFCVLTATSALRTAEDIRRSFELLQTGFDYVSSVTEYFFYPHAALVEDETSRLHYQWPEIAHAKGQELPNFVVENGAINWCRMEQFMRDRELMGSNTGAYRMPKYRSIDIDTLEDFQAMKALHRYLNDN